MPTRAPSHHLPAPTLPQVRQYSVSQFAKHYVKFPHEGQPDAARDFCAAAAAAYEPKRKFRKQVCFEFLRGLCARTDVSVKV